MNTAFKYLMRHPLMRASDYPYTAKDEKCKHVDAKGIVKLKGYNPLPNGDVKKQKAAVAKQPLAVAL